MRQLRASVTLAILLAGSGVAAAQQPFDVKGTWLPTEGAHILDGPTRHIESGTDDVPGSSRLKTHSSKFVFRFEGQEGRSFWGTLSSAKVTEQLIGVFSVDGKRFVIVDEDGTFDGLVVDSNTLDYCYTHVTPTNRAVACGLLEREK